jgi:hypothetical protein
MRQKKCCFLNIKNILRPILIDKNTTPSHVNKILFDDNNIIVESLMLGSYILNDIDKTFFEYGIHEGDIIDVIFNSEMQLILSYLK